MDEARQRFERSLVVTLYCVGVRGAALALFELGPEASALVRTLSSTDQKTRALGLAREIARIGHELDQGALG